MSTGHLRIDERHVPTHDGWQLHLRRTVSPAHFRPDGRPLVIVPGYGMNSFIFGYHPRGTSLERTLAEAGFEVWSVNLRAQGGSRPLGERAPEPELSSYATIDVPAALDHVLDETATTAGEVALIGCSLGGSVAYSYLALTEQPRVGKLITIGAPLRWHSVHPVVRALFASPALVGAIRVKRTRAMVRGLMPLLLRMPALLSMYMNTASIATEHLAEMANTVEDPHPAINRDIARWIRARDLTLCGVDITRAMARVRVPLLVVLANRDGIVPERTALTAIDAWGGDDVEVLRVGDRRDWYAHANLFIADRAPEKVFQPMIRWLSR
jgi:pimeloyl-ACP methyl ester carboxylesterase